MHRMIRVGDLLMDIIYEKDENKTVSSDKMPFDISFYKGKDYFMSIDNYVKFVKACEHMVRKHPDYDSIVAMVREEYMDHCQVLGNISRFDATLEIHHGPLTLFDYCGIVTNALAKKDDPLLNTFNVSRLVLNEHMLGNVQFIVLTKTVHQLIDSGELFLNLNQGIGNMNNFLKKFKDGLDDVYIDKINTYIDMSKKYESTDNHILDLEENMVNWSYR